MLRRPLGERITNFGGLILLVASIGSKARYSRSIVFRVAGPPVMWIVLLLSISGVACVKLKRDAADTFAANVFTNGTADMDHAFEKVYDHFEVSSL